MTAAKKIDYISVGTLAERCLESCQGDWKKAAAKMEREVRSNAGLYSELMDPLVSGAVWERVRQAARSQRRSFHNAATAPKSPKNDGLEAVAQSWYDYPIYGGVRLGDATREDLQSAIDGYRMHEQSNRMRREFMERIYAKLPDGKRVRETLHESEIERIAE